MTAPAVRRRRRVLFVVLLAGTLLLAVVLAVRGLGGGPRQGGDMAERTRVDGDAPLLTYERITRHPTKQGNLRLVIDGSGAVRAQRNDADPPAGQDWTAELPVEPSGTVRNAPAKLAAALRDGHFFEMDERQVNEAGTDGTVRVLTWNGDGGPRTVTVDRASSPDFDRIVGEIARLTSVPGL